MLVNTFHLGSPNLFHLYIILPLKESDVCVYARTAGHVPQMHVNMDVIE